MSRQLPFKALKTFESVIRNGGFSRAADELHVTQSAVSHQVAALERWVGRPLFDRNGARPRVSERGETLAGALNTAFAAIEAACELARAPDVADNALTIAVIPSVASCWLIPRLSGFRRDYPEISLRVMYAIHGQAVDFGDVGLAITYSRAALVPAGVAMSKLLDGASAPVCSRSHFDANGPLDGPDQIMAGGLLHDTDKSGWTEWLSKTAGRSVVPPKGPVYEDFNLLRAAALAGQGTALCPLAVIADDLRDGRLCVLSDRTVFDDSAYYVVEPRRADPRPSAAAVFRHWLLEQAGQIEVPENSVP